jgi:hypothetical protein
VRLCRADLPIDGGHDLGGEQLDGAGRLGERQAAEADLRHVAAVAQGLVDFEELLGDLKVPRACWDVAAA